MNTASFYQSTADAIGVMLYLYPDGSVTNFRKVDAEPTATIEPHANWRPPGGHGLGDQLKTVSGSTRSVPRDCTPGWPTLRAVNGSLTNASACKINTR